MYCENESAPFVQFYKKNKKKLAVIFKKNKEEVNSSQNFKNKNWLLLNVKFKTKNWRDSPIGSP